MTAPYRPPSAPRPGPRPTPPTGIRPPQQPGPGPLYGRERPGCVTFYAVLIFITVGLAVLGLLLMVSIPDVADVFDDALGSYGLMGYGVAGLLIYVLLVGFQLLVGIGLWRMRNWARVLIIISAVISVISGVFSLFSGAIVPALIGLTISGVILYWFASHRADFS